MDSAGKVLVSGIVAQLDRALATGLLRLAAASLPDATFVAALQRLKAAGSPKPPQLTAQPRKQRAAGGGKPTTQLASVSISLQSWNLSYSAAPAPLPEHSSRQPTGAMLQVQHRLAIGSVGTEVLLPQKIFTAHVFEMAVSQQECQSATAAAPGSSGNVSFPEAGDVQTGRLLHVASVLAGVLPAGHAALQPGTGKAGSQDAAAAAAVGSSPAASPADAAAGDGSSSSASPAVDLDICGVSVRFEPDVAFGAVDTAGELAAIAEGVRQQLPPHWQQQLMLSGNKPFANPAASVGSGPAAKMPRQQKAGAKLRMAVRLHSLAAEAALGPDVCFAIQVCRHGSRTCLPCLLRCFVPANVCQHAYDANTFHAQVGTVEHHVGTLAADVSTLAVQLNGQDVATVLQIRAAAELLGASAAPAGTAAAGNGSILVSGAAGSRSSSSVQSASKSSSSGRPQLTIQVPGGEDGSSGVGAEAAPQKPGAPPSALLAMPSDTESAGLARARARAGISDDSYDPVMTPAVIVTAAVAGARVLLPHGCELGTAIRGTELWAKAFSQVWHWLQLLA